MSAPVEKKKTYSHCSDSRRRKSTEIELQERRRQVAILLQQNLSCWEISQRLGFAASTISNDIKALKQVANQFVYDLAREDMAYFYVDSIKDIDRARATAWGICEKLNDKQVGEKIAALKGIVSCNVERFKLLTEGPNILEAKSLNERVCQLESEKETVNRNG